MRRRITSVWADKRGATAVEYGLIVSMIVIAMIVGLTQVATTTTGLWDRISNTVQGR